MEYIILWLNGSLRFQDNTAWIQASKTGKPVLVVLTQEKWDSETHKNSVENFQNKFHTIFGTGPVMYSGPMNEFIRNHEGATVYANMEYFWGRNDYYKKIENRILLFKDKTLEKENVMIPDVKIHYLNLHPEHYVGGFYPMNCDTEDLRTQAVKKLTDGKPIHREFSAGILSCRELYSYFVGFGKELPKWFEDRQKCMEKVDLGFV